MTGYQAQQIRSFRMRGTGYKAIATATGLSRDVVRNYCKKHGLIGAGPVLTINMTELIKRGLACRNCGAPLVRAHTGRPPRYCSAKCKTAWWGAHSRELRETSPANYMITCAGCGREFTSYGNRNRKYCSHDCYVAHRFSDGAPGEERTE